jgi:hypothetical protein
MSNAGDGKPPRRSARCAPLPMRTFGDILAHPIDRPARLSEEIQGLIKAKGSGARMSIAALVHQYVG